MLPSSLGLDRFPHLHTRDFDVALDAHRRVHHVASGDATGGGHGFEWRVNVVDVGPLAFMRGGHGGGEVVLAGVPLSHLLNLTHVGNAEAVAGEARTDIAGGRSAALFSPGMPAKWRRDGSAHTTTTTVRIDPGYVVRELEALTGGTGLSPVRFALRVRTDQGAGASVERMCAFLIGELERGAEALAGPVVTSNLCQALVSQLLLGQPHDHAHLLEKPPPPSGRSVVRFVEEYLEAHAAEPLRMAELAALTGVSLRSIEVAFRAQRGTTPGAFLRDQRLSLARRSLLAPAAGLTVTRAAHAAGFLRRARFEALYLAKFGETPHQTWIRGLAATAPSAPAADAAIGGARLAARLEALSLRERQVCEGVARGMLNKQIAAELGIAEGTVKVHRARGMARLGVTSAVELALVLGRLQAGVR